MTIMMLPSFMYFYCIRKKEDPKQQILERYNNKAAYNLILITKNTFVCVYVLVEARGADNDMTEDGTIK